MNMNWFWNLALTYLLTPAVIGSLGLWIGAAARKMFAKSVSVDILTILETFLTNVASSFGKGATAASVKGAVWVEAQKRIPETIAELKMSPEVLADKVIEKIAQRPDDVKPVMSAAIPLGTRSERAMMQKYSKK